MIDLLPNSTIFYQWVIFMIALATLHFGIFKPVLRIIAERRNRTQGARETAHSLQHRSEEMLAQCEKKIGEAKALGLEKRAAHLQAGEKVKEELLGKTRAEINQQMEKIRHQIEAETREASLQLKQYAQQISHDVASKVLGREV